MADVKISGLPASTTPLAGTEVLPIVQGGQTRQVSVSNLTSGRAISTAGITNTGNLTFSGNALRLTGKFSGAPVTDRLHFQTSTTNDITSLGIIPNGSATQTQINLESDSAITNGTFGSLALIGPTELRITSSIRGTGSYVPLTMHTGGSEKARLDTSGNLSLSTGNLVIGTSGKGIDFSANSQAAGMTSELLTWYEEGTWTPAISADTVGDLTVVYSTQAGFYTRVGRTVTVNFSMITSTFTRSTASGNARITGLPFTVNASATAYHFGATAFQGIQKANYTQVVCVPFNNATYLILSASAPATNQNAANVAITEMPSGGIVVLRGSVTYIV